MHEQYPKRVNEKDVDHQMTNKWLRSGGLKSETEGFIIAAQDQAIKINYYRRNILNDGTDPMCRICGQYQETIDHIVAGCPELAKTEYVHRRDKAASYLHWNICRAKYKRRRVMVWAWTPNSNRKRHHNLVGYANTDRPWDKSQQTRHCSKDKQEKAAYSLICPSLLKRTHQLKLLKSCQNTKISKSRLSECGGWRPQRSQLWLEHWD